MNEDVIVRTEGRLGRLSLNRPQALNALNLAMCEAMLDALDAWRDAPAVDGVLLDHASGRGFCAGADIRRIAAEGSTLGRPFFATEYRLNHALFTYPKPVIAIMDGVVMGGGAGLALPARARIATERTVFAMPETAIGLIPDVGGGWHLPRLRGEAGTWLGLTGARLDGADCLALGVATHLVSSSQIDALKSALIRGDALPAPTRRLPSSLDHARIDALFAADRIEDIRGALRCEGSDWALRQAAALESCCPMSLVATLRHLRTGREMADFAQVLEQEYRLCTRLVDRSDFREGVRAALVDKNQAPSWRPSRLEAVAEDAVNTLFAPLPFDEAWRP
jgi:enoyl-CoA hydratase